MDSSNHSGHREAYHGMVVLFTSAEICFVEYNILLPTKLDLYFKFLLLLTSFGIVFVTALVDFEWAVKLNRFTLNLIGLWPKPTQSHRQKLLCDLRVLVVFLALTLGILVPSIHSLIRIYGDIMLMIDNLQFTLPATSCSIRIVIFWWKKEGIVPVMNMIAEDWLKSKSAQERSMMIRRAQIARIIITCTYSIMGLACFFSIVLPIFGLSIRLTTNITDPGRLMPLQTYYIYDETKSPLYELTFISQSVYILLAAMSYSGIDNFLGLLVFHICGQMDILKSRLIQLDKCANAHYMLKNCVTNHIRLLRAIAIIEDTYNLTLLTLFVYFAVHLSFYGFRIIDLFDEGNDLSITNLIYLSSTVVNIFAHMCLYCTLGEILMGQCNEIYYAVYKNEWYSMDLKVTKDLLCLLIRGTRPVFLTAGKVFPMTMATFCSIDFEWAVKLNRFTLDLIGLWPKTAQNHRQKLMSDLRMFIVLLGIIFGILVPSIHSLIRISGNIMLMIDNLQFTLPSLSCSIRILIFWWKKEAIVPIMDMVAEDWMNSKSVEERRVMIRRAQSARIIITCAYCIMAVACFFVVILPCFGISMRLTPNITDPGRPMPLQTYYIYDITRSPQYELTFISQAVYVVVAMMSYSGIDNFLGLLVFHICGQLDILKSRLTHLDKYVNSHDMLKSCVAKHTRLLRAIAVIEDTYNLILLALFAYFAILFALYGFRFINIFDEGNDLSITHLIYFLSTILNIFAHMCLYCALGEILMTQCNEIYYAVYKNEWYSMDLKIAKDLLSLLIRGTRPIFLTAGKVFPMTMSTFCYLMKTSAGYISVLHTTRS